MNNNLRTSIFITGYVVSIILLSGHACLSDYEIQHPIIIYPDTISICFMPFRGSDKASDSSDYRDFIANKLLDLDDFNYKVLSPDKCDLEYIYQIGFAERSHPKRLTKLHPLADFWRNMEIMYVLFGSYELAPDSRLTIEAYLFDSTNDLNIVQKKYTGTVNEIDRILERIANLHSTIKCNTRL